MASIPEGSIEDFTRATRYPLQDYFNRCVEFMDFHRLNIISYYSGYSSRPNEVSFSKLKRLLKQADAVESAVENNANNLRSAALWELYDVISDMKSALDTINNSSKWLRSAITKNNFSPDVEVEVTLNQLQTLEQLTGTILGSTNRDQDWVRLALRNDLHEEAYTPEGGNKLQVSYKNRATIRLNSVVDNISGEKVYGIDLQRKLEFKDNDLVALSYKDTLIQSVTILAKLRQGDTPEFPGDGIKSSLVVGSNKNSISYPVLFRQYYSTFRRDDTLKALAITNIVDEQDSLAIEFQVETRLGEVVTIQS